jgi:hypothetical protein
MKIENLYQKLILSSLLSVMLFQGNNVMAEDPTNVAVATAGAKAVKADGVKPKQAKEIEVTQSTPDENCRLTRDNAVKECLNPTGQGFKQAAQLLTTLPAIATAFMGGGDPGKMAEMCKLTTIMGAIGGMLNGGQDTTCQQASAACQSSCGKGYDFYRQQESQAVAARDSAGARQAQMKQEDMKTIDDDCQKQVQAQMQLAQQQQQANQQPMAGAEACQAALDSNPEDEIVDCTQPKFANAAECTTIGKTAGNGITFEKGPGISANESDADLPALEDREDYWNSLKNKTSGGTPSGNSGTGALGGSGSNGGFGNAAQKAGGSGKKSGSSLMSGGSESSGGGGGGWGNMSGDDFDKKYSKLSDKKKGLGMLTKKKIGGRNIAAAEFGSSSDDIWTRVYLRTNTRCTKQLTECTANKSLNPYGVNKAR